MNANEQFIAAQAHVDEAAVQPLPNSRKVYITGSRPDLRVPFREVALQATRDFEGGKVANAPVRLYDTSGPYTDPAAVLDVALVDGREIVGARQDGRVVDRQDGGAAVDRAARVSNSHVVAAAIGCLGIDTDVIAARRPRDGPVRR